MSMYLQVATRLCSRLLTNSFACGSWSAQTAAASATSGLGALHHQTAISGQQAPYHTSGARASEQPQRDSGKQRDQTFNEQTQEVSKSFITSVLNMEEAWLSGVAGQLKMWAATKKVPELEGKDKEHKDIVEIVRSEYLDTLKRAAAGRELSLRARSHLKQACLAAATHKVLLGISPGSDRHVEEFIMFNMGGVYSSFMLGGLKVSSWAKKWLLRESSMSQAVDTLHTIARDMEGACHCSIQPLCAVSESDDDTHEQSHQQQQQAAAGPGDQQQLKQQDPEAEAEAEAQKPHTHQQWQQGAALTVDSCMIAEVLQQEGVPQLLRFFCCQHNINWLKAYEHQGVVSRLGASIAKGDGCCRITVEPSH